MPGKLVNEKGSACVAWVGGVDAKKRLVLLSQFSLTLQINQCCYIADINAVHMHVTVSTEYRR